MYSRPVQPLFFRQTLLCAWLAGAAALQWTPALLLIPLLLLTDSRCHQRHRAALLVLCALCGLGYAELRQPQTPSATQAPRTDVSSTDAAKAGVPKADAPRISGTVREVRGLYDRRVSILLDEVRVDRSEKGRSEKGRSETVQTGTSQALPGKVNWTWENPDRRPLPGQQVKFSGSLKPMDGFRNTGASDSAAFWAMRGVLHRVWTPAGTNVTLSGTPVIGQAWRESARTALIARLHALYPDTAPPPAYGQATESAPHGWGFVPALLFGDRFYLGADDTNRLARSGLAHSIALSGQHLAVTGLLAAAGLWLLGRARPGVFLRVPRFVLGLWLTLPPAAGYVWLGNAPPSLLRAAFMLLCWTILCTLRRPMAFTDSLLAALSLMTLLDPTCLADVGVQLSFAAVAGLALGQPLFLRWMRLAGGNRLLALTGGLILSSAVIQLSTLPVVLEVFGWTSPWVLLNLLWLPVLGVWVLPLSALAFLSQTIGLSLVTDALLLAAVEPCHWLTELLRLLDTRTGLVPFWCLRPHWTAAFGFCALLLAVALSQARKTLPPAARRLTVIGCCLLFTGPFLRVVDGFDSRVRLRLLDVGQGQAALLEFPREVRVLVDGGGFRSARFDSGKDIVGPVLTRNRPPRITALALSHADQDHLRGLLFLADQFTVGEVLLPAEGTGHDAAVPLYTAFQRILDRRGIPVRTLAAGDEVRYAEVALQALAPLPGRVPLSNDGLVLRLAVQDATGLHTRGLVLLPGDATKSLLRAVEQADRPVQSAILVAPHHGSRNNVRAAFVQAVNPTAVLVSCGTDNRYGFPSRELQELCAELGIPLRTTADEGEIVWAE